MRSRLLLAVLALVLASCGSNSAESVALPSERTLVAHYGTLAPGTFHVRQQSLRLDVKGTEFGRGLSAPILFMRNRSIKSDNGSFFSLDVTSEDILKVGPVGAYGWVGGHSGNPVGSTTCSGTIYILESTASLLRAVLAGACGLNRQLGGPRDFTLFEGGFAYRR